MKSITLFSVLVLLIGTTGCLNDSNTKIERTPPPPQVTVPPPGSNSNTGVSPVTAPSQSTAAPVTAPVTTSASAVKLNPAHGQPGHRCDIAVGAPLDSKPGQVVAQPQATSTPSVTPVTPTSVQPVAAPQTTAPGLNPAHGQPGHRCDIAVGAPLNSKPTQ